ncbi:cobalamin-binding protein [Prolixibacteraceae bacterium JC049]|nr:cobalamin-binding protein [Prolixibacteraceae bacterium JC049]
MGIQAIVYENYFDALLRGDRQACIKLIDEQWDNKAPVRSIYEDLLKKALYEVGELWEENKISVATEHLASAITETILNGLFLKLNVLYSSEKKVLAGCVENELHQIGIKMICDTFEANGWPTFFLGANTPMKEFMDLARSIQPDIIALSVSIYPHIPELLKMLKIIRSEFTETPILVGGQGFRHGGLDLIPENDNVTYIEDTFAIQEYINQLSHE